MLHLQVDIFAPVFETVIIRVATVTELFHEIHSRAEIVVL